MLWNFQTLVYAEWWYSLGQAHIPKQSVLDMHWSKFKDQAEVLQDMAKVVQPVAMQKDW
jgi:hypothetical protein